MPETKLNRAQLIAEIYEVVLRPERYDRFMGLWELHISGAIDELGPTPSGNSPIDKHISDPELEDHFQRAYEILEILGREGNSVTNAKEFGLQKIVPTLFIAANGEIVEANQAARQLLGSATGLDDLTLMFSEKTFQKLKTTLLGLENINMAGQIHVFQLHSSQKTSSEGNDRQLFLAKPIRFSNNQPALLCIHALEVKWDKRLETLLVDAFGLTPSELQIGRALCTGKSLSEIAEHRQRSIHTLRVQVKSMLHKTATGSQADLVRVMVTLSSFGSDPGISSSISTKHLEFGTQTFVPVKEKRNMPVHKIGAPNGRPVLFIHGMLDGIAVCRSVANILTKENILLIAPVRPSFSDSPPAYDITTAPEEFATDLRHVMDHFDISSAPIIGHMAGSIYAFVAAALLPERISAVLNISGGVPIKSFRQLSSMSRRQRIVAWTAKFAPKLLPAIIRTGISQIDRGDETEFMNALYAPGSRDRKVVADESIRAAIHAGYQFAIAQGHRAFEVDSRHVTSDWSRYVFQMHQRVILVNGIFDPTVTINSVREFADRYDNIELEEHNDAGQLLFYQKPNEIISTILKLLQD